MNHHRLLAVQLKSKQQKRLNRQAEIAWLGSHDDLLAPTKQSLLVEMQLEGLVLLILAIGLISFLVSHWS